MPATWTAPRTWINGEIPNAAIMNTHIRDNLLYLEAADAAEAAARAAADAVLAAAAKVTITRTAAITSTITTSSGTLADMTGFTTPVTTAGGWLHVELLAADAAGGEPILSQDAIDRRISIAAVVGATVLPELTILRPSTTVFWMVPLTVFHWWTKPAAGTPTIKLQWRTGGAGTGTFTLTGTAGAVLQVTEHKGT